MQCIFVMEDHPRVCGEQSLEDTDRGANGGSPPRVRGTVVVGSTKTPSRGITPACAGNSYHLCIHRSTE